MKLLCNLLVRWPIKYLLQLPILLLVLLVWASFEGIGDAIVIGQGQKTSVLYGTRQIFWNWWEW